MEGGEGERARVSGREGGEVTVGGGRRWCEEEEYEAGDSEGTTRGII